MGRKKAVVEAVAPSKPPCMSCGKPGDFEITIAVKELVLERDAGITSRPYWKSEYRSGTEIRTILCAVCKSTSVRIDIATSASITSAEEVP